VKKVLTAFILCTVITLNGYALIEVGLEGGYFFGNITLKEVYRKTTTTEAGSTWVKDTTYTPTGIDAETRHPKGLGLTLFSEITPPFLPIGVELRSGFSFTSFRIGKCRHTINSVDFSLLGKHSLKIPIFSPYIKIGPFLALNTHKIKPMMINFRSKRTFNFGISCGIGAKIGLIPRFPLNIGLLYNYYIVSKAEFYIVCKAEFTSETSSGGAHHFKDERKFKYSQQDVGIFFGITHKIL
jgi:hypothetical protein